MQRVPELLAPAGSLDAAKAAFANGADAVYLGVGRFNARDDGAQVSLDDLREACAIAHSRGAKVYLTLNVLVKPAELADALHLLGDCVDRGIDAVLVQDLGLAVLIRSVYPHLQVHGSTQMSIHDADAAAVVRGLGATRVVLARENTLEDIRTIRSAVPEVGVETFVHGALCISYSGQCFMSGMISERSANRGSCAQSCRKDYVLAEAGGAELDRGYLISAKDLGAYDHLRALQEAGVECLKIEGRKKKPEYVATVTRTYREFLTRVANGSFEPPAPTEVQPLVQIFSRGFTGGMFGGRAGREYITRTHPDNHGLELGRVVEANANSVTVDTAIPIHVGDGLGFEPLDSRASDAGVGFAVREVEDIGPAPTGGRRLRIGPGVAAQPGWRVRRTRDVALVNTALASFDSHEKAPVRKEPLAVRAFGAAGASLKLVFTAAGDAEQVVSAEPLRPAREHALDEAKLRAQLGRLGETPFVLAGMDVGGLGGGLFLPVSELNRMRQSAVEALVERRGWSDDARRVARDEAIEQALAVGVSVAGPHSPTAEPRRDRTCDLIAEVWRIADAHAAADAGATEVVLDPFIRHPLPPRTRVKALADTLRANGVSLRLRTPSVVRPEDRKALEPWLALGLPLVTGHLGLVASTAKAGADVVADYATNCFNAHTAVVLFGLGARRITPSIELTADELRALVAPWGGSGFDVVVYGRTEGMTIEHCVLSAAFEREPTTCRDLCVQKHTNVELTDPAGYVFPVATDSDCRNRLLHSRPLDGAAYIARLWASGIRGYKLIFNVPGDSVAPVVAAYRTMLDALGRGEKPDVAAVRAVVGNAYTRGHFERAV